MNIVFRYEDRTAQLILNPTSSIDESHLSLFRRYGDRNLALQLGRGKELIIEVIANGNSEFPKKEGQTKGPLECLKDGVSTGSPVQG